MQVFLHHCLTCAHWIFRIYARATSKFPAPKSNYAYQYRQKAIVKNVLLDFGDSWILFTSSSFSCHCPLLSHLNPLLQETQIQLTERRNLPTQLIVLCYSPY